MQIAVRYYSRSGNTKALAEAIAEAAAVRAVSVDAADAALTEPVDVLFIGGALYAYGLDSHLKAYLQSLRGASVKKAVVFSTSWLSKHAVDLIRKALEQADIPVDAAYFYAKNKPDAAKCKEAAAFAELYL